MKYMYKYAKRKYCNVIKSQKLTISIPFSYKATNTSNIIQNVKRE